MYYFIWIWSFFYLCLILQIQKMKITFYTFMIDSPSYSHIQIFSYNSMQEKYASRKRLQYKHWNSINMHSRGQIPFKFTDINYYSLFENRNMSENLIEWYLRFEAVKIWEMIEMIQLHLSNQTIRVTIAINNQIKRNKRNQYNNDTINCDLINILNKPWW